jgi:acyl-CoA reductase-like NAD-dependent aldehyde dehydrogenase
MASAASYTPVSSLLMAEMLAQTNLPPGAFSVLPCSRTAGNVLVDDPRIKVLSFTGSPSVRLPPRPVGT